MLDAYGHVSVRHPTDPRIFIMCRNTPPATVSSRGDLIEYWVDNAEPVDPAAAPGYAERCIHSEVLKRYPEVNCVIHSHSEAVVPYTISGMSPTSLWMLFFPIFFFSIFCFLCPVSLWARGDSDA